MEVPGEHEGLLLAQTDVGTPTPPEFGLPTTSAVPVGGNVDFVTNGTEGEPDSFLYADTGFATVASPVQVVTTAGFVQSE